MAVDIFCVYLQGHDFGFDSNLNSRMFGATIIAVMLCLLMQTFFLFGSRNLPTIMSWVEAQKPGVDGVNIITSDFVDLTDFANIVIKLNNLLLSEQNRKPR